MLSAILGSVRVAGRPVSMAELRRELGIDAAVLEGMLETLVARGKLRVVEPAQADCGGCPVRGGCMLMTPRVSACYALATQPDHAAPPAPVVRACCSKSSP